MATRPTEFVELNHERRWEYLRGYWEVASRFYQPRPTVLEEGEVQQRVRAFKVKPRPKFRKVISLTDWRFCMDEADAGVRKGFFSVDFDDSEWDRVRLPHSVRYSPKEPVRFGRHDSIATCRWPGEYCNIWRGDYHTWYRSRLPGVRLAGDEAAWLAVDSVNLLCDIWVNEHPVMLQHLDLYPFTMGVAEELKAGERMSQDTVIALKVSNTVTNVPFLFSNGFQFAYSNPPYTEGRQPLDWIDQSWSGIAGEVNLHVANRAHLSDAFVFTRELEEHSAHVTCRVEAHNAFWHRFRGRVRLEISKWLSQHSV